MNNSAPDHSNDDLNQEVSWEEASALISVMLGKSLERDMKRRLDGRSIQSALEEVYEELGQGEDDFGLLDVVNAFLSKHAPEALQEVDQVGEILDLADGIRSGDNIDSSVIAGIQEKAAKKVGHFGGRSKTIRRGDFEDVGRNDKCPCESGKKYKKCHKTANALRKWRDDQQQSEESSDE